PSGQSTPMTGPRAVKTTKPTTWFQNEAMSAVVDSASLPLSWRERETRMPTRRAKRMASVIVLSLTEDDDHRAGKDQRERREILEPGDAFGEAEQAPAVGGEREEDLTGEAEGKGA